MIIFHIRNFRNFDSISNWQTYKLIRVRIFPERENSNSNLNMYMESDVIRWQACEEEIKQNYITFTRLNRFIWNWFSSSCFILFSLINQNPKSRNSMLIKINEKHIYTCVDKKTRLVIKKETHTSVNAENLDDFWEFFGRKVLH